MISATYSEKDVKYEINIEQIERGPYGETLNELDDYARNIEGLEIPSTLHSEYKYCIKFIKKCFYFCI